MNESKNQYGEPKVEPIPQKQNKRDDDALEQNDFAYYVRLFGILISIGRCLEILFMYRDNCISYEDAQKRITTIIEELE